MTCAAGVALALAPAAVRAAAPQITSFTPTSGPLGTKVTVKGTALSTPTAATVDKTTATFVGNSATQVTVTVPATASGPIAITTAGGTGTSSTPFTIIPGLTLSPTSGHPSIEVTVTGAGFGPYTSVDVYFDTTDTALAVSNGLGVVSIQIQVPTGAQPGAHWITLDERANHNAAQQSFTVNTNWDMQGYSATGNGVNPFENTLNTGNVAGLTMAWSEPSGGLANQSPFVEVNGTVFVGDVNGGIHAYSSSGKLLWNATETVDFEASPPAASGAYVYFGGNGGNSVYAFKTTCRTDGGVCAPTWTANIGTYVSAGLTVDHGVLYVPGGDGEIHTINPLTGALGTPITAFGSTAPISTPVAFAADGSYYFGSGSTLFFYSAIDGGGGYAVYSAAVSGITISSGRAYFTTQDGNVHRFNGWSAATPSGTCYSQPQPVVADNLVFAGGCSSITAFEASSGAEYWSVTTNGPVLYGLSVANGVLYGCIDNVFGSFEGELAAFDASSGGLLWTGGGCTSAPVIANGNLFGALVEISAYNLPQLSSTAVVARPELSALKPDLQLAAERTPD